jgi:hypothetical protein
MDDEVEVYLKYSLNMLLNKSPLQYSHNLALGLHIQIHSHAMSLLLEPLIHFREVDGGVASLEQGGRLVFVELSCGF